MSDSLKQAIKERTEAKQEQIMRVRIIKEQQASDFAKRLTEARLEFSKIATRDEANAEQHIFIMAENLSVKNWEIPPHWTGFLDCKLCGQMPAPKDADGMKCDACPWCHSHPEVLDRFDIAEREAQQNA